MTTLLFSLKNIIAPENNWLQSGQANPSAENEELNGPPASMGWEARQSRQEAALRVSSRLATSGYVSSHCKFMTLETTCWCWWSFAKRSLNYKLMTRAVARGCGSFLWSDNSLAWVKQIKTWTGDPSSTMSWMNSERRVGADNRTEGYEEIKSDFPQESLVRFSGGQTLQKSKIEDISHTWPGILSSHNGRCVTLSGRSLLR